MKVSEILKVTGGKLLSGDREADIDLSKVSTDSRSIKKGELFIALDGPNFRGSDFAGAAFEKGAIGAIISRPAGSPGALRKIIIKVKDTTRALQDIAASHRKKFSIPVICITGSNGKTTVKDMIAAILSERYNVLKTEGTKNNHIGVPQTLLRLNNGHDICVLELGTNHQGEIRALSSIAGPTMAVLTNIGASHLEFLSDLEGVYNEKRRIIGSLAKGGTVIVNGDDRFLKRIRPGSRRLVRYGLDARNDLRAENIRASGDGIGFRASGTEFALSILGGHNVHNALAAIAASSQFNISRFSMKKALAGFRPADMRLNRLKVGNISIINDSYNSNPLSVESALKTAVACAAKARWIVFGDMLELGKQAVYFHKMAGRLVAASGADGLLALGKFSGDTIAGASAGGMRRQSLWRCGTHGEIVGILKRVAASGDLVLVKGSRGMRMERVIEGLKG